jgi:serine/threonine-protein kinase
MATGDRFAGFRIIRPLGAGGMGQVFLVEHPRLPRQEALKVLSPELSNDPDYRQRFAREADLAARLWHPHIVEVRDRGETGGQLWISMAYVDGEDAARQLVRKYPAGMPAATVVPIVTAVASALDYAHGQGLLHRDVKPANIFISSPDSGGDTRVLLGDFGIARELADAAGMTATNMTLGTVAYAAPEQLNGDVMDGRADQYALAATAHHLLTGTPLFPVTNPVAAISRHLTAPPPKLSASHPHLFALDAVLAKALSKNPAERYPRCADFAEAFAAAAGGNPSAISPTAPTQQAPVPPPAAAPPPAPAPTATPAPTRPRWILPAALASAAVLVAGLLVWKPWATNDMPSAPSDRAVGAAAPGSGEQPAPSIAAVPPIGDPDLGLAIPISRPACDGSGIVVLDSAYTPGRYRDDVARALSNNPGASYLRTDLSCPSLRQQSDDGNPIYAVYRLAGTSKEQLCAAVTAAGPGTYGRWLDTISDPDVTVDCPKRSPSVEEAPVAVVDVDPASYMLWSGLYRFAYSISPFRECALHVPNGISTSLWCETQFPPGTPQVSSDPPDGYEPVIGPPKMIRIEPPAGPEPSIAEGAGQKGRPMLPNHRITVGEFTCTTLPGNSVNCTAPTGEFRITNGVFTAEP